MKEYVISPITDEEYEKHAKFDVYVNVGQLDLDDIPLDMLLEDIEKIKNKILSEGYRDVTVNCQYEHGYFDGSYPKIIVNGYRKETKEEVERRLHIEKMAKEIKKEEKAKKKDREYQTYLRLKKKYEDR